MKLAQQEINAFSVFMKHSHFMLYLLFLFHKSTFINYLLTLPNQTLLKSKLWHECCEYFTDSVLYTE